MTAADNPNSRQAEGVKDEAGGVIVSARLLLIDRNFSDSWAWRRLRHLR
jgi:hypothetical protein